MPLNILKFSQLFQRRNRCTDSQTRKGTASAPATKKLAEEVIRNGALTQRLRNGCQCITNIIWKSNFRNLAFHRRRNIPLKYLKGSPIHYLKRSAFTRHQSRRLADRNGCCFPFQSEMRKITKSGGVTINKERLENSDTVIDSSYLIGNKYVIAQRGKKIISC